jgi:hypothetical protein
MYEFSLYVTLECTRWFKYDRDKLWLVYTQIVPVIFEPPCIMIVAVFLLYLVYILLCLLSLHVYVLSDKGIDLFHIQLFNDRYWIFEMYMYVCRCVCTINNINFRILL